MKEINANTQEEREEEWKRRREANKDKYNAKLKEYVNEVKQEGNTALIDCKQCGKNSVEASTFEMDGKVRKNTVCLECNFYISSYQEGCEVCTCHGAPATVLYCRDKDGQPQRGDEFIFCADCGHMTLLGWGQYRWSCTVPEQMFASYWMERDGVSPKDVARDIADAKETGKEEDMERAMMYENIASTLQKEYAECDCGHENAMGVVHWDQESERALHEGTLDAEDVNRMFWHIYNNYEQPLPVGFTKYAVCCGKRTPGTLALEDLDEVPEE